MSETRPKRHWPPLALLPDFIKALLIRMIHPLRKIWRRSWIYRQMLNGKMPDRILFHPSDALPRRLEEADALLRGRFRFAAEAIEVEEGSVFDKRPPSRRWAEALHAFAWLPPLAAAGGDPARRLAANLLTQWVKRYTRYAEPAWLPHVTARRLINIFAHGRFVLSNSDMLWRSKLFVSLREQSRQLARTAGEAPEGLARFEAAAAHALSGACMDDSVKRLISGVQRLEAQIARQILPDGGHISRSPEALLHAYRHVVMLMEALAAIGRPVPKGIRSAHDRMAPMIRFFRHGDGGLALFNGGTEGDPRTINGLLARDDVRGQPFVYAPHSAYHRVVGGRSLVLVDCGTVPQGAFATAAHASCLAFEFSVGAQRLIVNCGSAFPEEAKWEDALRTTAAHSTVTIADKSQSAVLGPGLARDLLGPRLLGGRFQVESQRLETPEGWRVDASHEGYLRPFGVIHRRSLTLAPAGNLLCGTDTLTPKESKSRNLPYAARFHLHPDVRCSLSQRGQALLKLPNGEGWRFEAGGADVAVDESVYVSGETVRRTEQLVLSGTVKDSPVSVSWALEQIGT